MQPPRRVTSCTTVECRAQQDVHTGTARCELPKDAARLCSVNALHERCSVGGAWSGFKWTRRVCCAPSGSGLRACLSSALHPWGTRGCVQVRAVGNEAAHLRAGVCMDAGLCVSARTRGRCCVLGGGPFLLEEPAGLFPERQPICEPGVGGQFQHILDAVGWPGLSPCSPSHTCEGI